ncbi:hypothetical protein SJI19_05600 [Acerihabitans sp. TG2]|uniref:COG4648 family protein n=1 Tax=Acerihabitans sp. TG2 TaxID=3096008 RepID=UPI002B22E2B6|nr:hypothetical protein [Acerihabitans sp. TG2]MEA9390030.1 hypothetical protein [Acerihabitans sp. TG2]
MAARCKPVAGLKSPVGALRLFSLLAVLCYPFVIWFGLTHWRAETIALVMAVLFLLRLLTFRHRIPALEGLAKALALFGILLCLAGGLLKSHHLLLYYPVMMNVLMLLLFGTSLLGPTSLVEQLARLRQPVLPPEAIIYTRRVTQIWCVFFIVNGTVALFTCLHGNMPLWALYNGGISYLLMGLLMGTEWIIRTRKRIGQ